MLLDDNIISERDLQRYVPDEEKSQSGLSSNTMKVRDKEHQSLGIKELKQLSYDFPNDAKLGAEIRAIIRRKEEKPSRQ